MSIKEGNIELHMGPSQLGAPDNLQDVIVGFIDGAKKRLDVAVQELESTDRPGPDPGSPAQGSGTGGH